jgi:predicted Zn-dependent peptidase
MQMALRHRTVTAVGLVVLVCASASVAGVKTHDLPHDLTLVTAPHSWNRIVAVTMAIDAGSKYDPPGRRGLASVTAEMLSRGTETMTGLEISEEVDGLGMRLTVHTNPDYIIVSVAAADKQFDAAVDILADVVTNPAFDSKPLLEVQGMIHDKLIAEKDDVFATTFFKLNEALYKGHPYGHREVGTPDGIDAITRQDVVSFHEERYHGGNSVVAVVGNFDREHAVDKITDAFADYPGGHAKQKTFGRVERDEPMEIEYYRAGKTGFVTVGFLGPEMFDDAYVAFEVLAAVLGNGTSSRVYQALGPDGAAISDIAGASASGRFEQSPIVIYAQSEDIDEAIDIIGGVVQDVHDEPVPVEELDRAKARLKGMVTMKEQTNLQKSARLAVGTLAGFETDFLEEFFEEMETIDGKDVMKIARKYLVNPVKVVQRPGKEAKRRSRRGGI